jgi:glycosyltransferase involved in cell wall biosynthesis
MHRWGWSELPRLLRLVRRVRPDMVNIHFTGEIYHHQPMITFLPSILRRLFEDISVVTLIEYPMGANLNLVSLTARLIRKGVTTLVGRNGVDWGYGTLLRDSQRLIVLSDQHRQILEDHLLNISQKTTVLPPPPLLNISTEECSIARQRGRELLAVGAEEFLVAYYGLLYPGKGIETLLEAIRLVNQQGKPIVLALIGGSNEVILQSMNRKGYVQELEALCARLGIQDNVRFTGYYPSESDHGSVCLKAADICVLPFDEGVMLNRSSVAAAAIHELPIITTKGAILEAPFIDRENVLLCPPKDPNALALAIRAVMSSPDLRIRLKEGAGQLAREWFSWDNAVALFMEMIQRAPSEIYRGSDLPNSSPDLGT